MHEARANKGRLGVLFKLKKALQGSEIETRKLLEGVKENNVLPGEGLLICEFHAISKILQQKIKKKNKSS